MSRWTPLVRFGLSRKQPRFSHSVVVEPGVVDAVAEAEGAEAETVDEEGEADREGPVEMVAVGLETDPVAEGVSPVVSPAEAPAQVVPSYLYALSEYHPPHVWSGEPMQGFAQTSEDFLPPPAPNELPQ